MGPSASTSVIGANISPVVSERPVIVAVDDVDNAHEQLRGELERRYDRDYDVVVEASPVAALAAVDAARVAGQHVAVVLASQWMTERNGTDVLSSVRVLSPRTKRGLLIALDDWGQPSTAVAIQSGGASCGSASRLGLRVGRGFVDFPEA
jgi:DNA-binding NarL/FixJ family response regulator